jgi:sensor histidine kinase regulating citrate/malate metabolism
LTTSPIFWAVIVVTVVVAIAVAKLIAVRKAKAEAARALAELRPVAAECRISGHVYKEYDTGWRCATCGNHVPRRDGELYGLVTDGKHERRRNPR